MKKILMIAAVAAVALLSSCKKEEAVKVESINVTPETLALTVGENAAVSAAVLPENAADKSVSWTSSNPEVATVSENGLVSAVASGSAVITATTADGALTDECAVTVTPKSALYSFTNRKYLMSASATVEINLVNTDGSAYVAEEAIEIPVKVNTEKSSAVEGTNFKFAAEKKAVVGIGKSKATVVLDCVAQEAGKDIVVLDFDIPAEASYLIAGQYVSTTITIFGSYADQLKGTWVMDRIETDATFMDEMWWGMLSMEGFPTFNAEDTMTFGDNGLETSFKSEFKNFFKEQSDISLGSEMELHANITSWQDIRTVQLITLSNTNRYFCADQQSEDTESIIGVRINEDGELEVFLIDCEYRGFFAELIEWGINDEKPVIGDSSGSYIIFVMKRA